MTHPRELAHRHQDGLEVTLLWDARSGVVSIELVDDRDESRSAFAVDPGCALDAFNHPFAYAPAIAPEPLERALLAVLEGDGGRP